MKNKKIWLIILLLITLFLIFRISFSEKNLLREVASEKQFLIGASVSASPFLTDEKYKTTLKQEFNLLTIENELKFSKVHPQRETYNFLIPDIIVDFAEENKMKVRGHTLVWYHSNPDWLTNQTYSREEMISILKGHIQTVVGHYKGKIYAWDIVNEAFNEDGTLRENIWLKTIGPEYIELSFEWAHEADPNALLYYNDFNNERMNKKSDAIYKMVKNFKKRGIPIDGVGFQMHSSITYEKNYDQLKENFKRFEEINVDVQITEMDVKVQHSKDSYNERLNQQAKMYADTLDVCLSADNCSAFVTWGISDRYSWIPDYTGNEDFPLLFDEDYQPKPSYDEIYHKLKEY
ncbi:endo-1,4-beta-xylanase [Metabacillus litoralis]|uniref:endo-1,4-beta-xylanase n=1 Tax=Metabacillus litoralis TaxID=152268 RepID=UPI00203E9E5F|nr:endo-1,4-beta-xylanase [Metabacillus litoralis]MCM3652928.1 endo-1,4-beta-xylanase [Metabacillus litoralis]